VRSDSDIAAGRELESRGQAATMTFTLEYPSEQPGSSSVSVGLAY